MNKKKYFKPGLKVLLSILVLLIVAVVIGVLYINSTFLNFEKDYAEDDVHIQKISVDGKTILDRNGNGKLDVYEDDRQSIEARANDLSSQMTIEEKIHLLKGSGMKSGLSMGDPKKGIPGAVGTIVPTPRLGIPTVYLSDGPAGLRIEPIRENDNKTYYCTAFPIATLLASSWNTDLVKNVGEAMGNEALEYGIDVILAPGVNIHRNPLCGRNFEYYSEDPVLTGNMGAAIVNGIESNGVGTSIKHFVANNQETNRFNNDVRISERALREIYLKGFEIIIKKSQPWSIMSSYNLVNGTYTSENKYLLTNVLRDDWGFEGIVMTDWFGGNDAPAQISAGNDLLEPGTKRQWKALEKAYENEELSEESIDTAVKRILKLILNSKKMQDYAYDNNPDLKGHALIARQAAAEGMVLLKNQNTLPLSNVKNVAMIGVTSYDFIAGGTGSGDVNEAYTVSLEEGLKNIGFEINKTAKDAFEAFKKANSEAFEKPEGMKSMFTPYTPPEMNYSDELLKQCAASTDIAIITIGRNSGEGGDRVEKDDFLLSNNETEMIDKTCTAFHALGKKVVVVLNIGGVIETNSWKEMPDAILLAWQGGQESGNAVADILSGKVNPSGKLPMTFPIHLKDHASTKNFPLVGTKMSITDMLFGNKQKPKEEQIKNIDYTVYEEGIYIGYRYFDKNKTDVAYPFGYGLSYTDFKYSNMETVVLNDTINIKLSVSNVGNLAGKDVVQVYVSKPDTKIDRPVKELKAFAKSLLIEPGDTVEMTFRIPSSELAYWNEDNSTWTLEKGSYTIQLASSSRDIRLSTEIDI
ncbi:MAG: beta-glucosidase [Bacteroidetes bacterium]|nr:MAG: beta-glucosidase [Bacteroidota bacterium]